MRHTEPPFAQLRPLLGDRVKALEYAWRTSLPSERAEIEIVIELLRLQATDERSLLLAPPAGHAADGPVRLGQIMHGKAMTGGWAGLDERQLAAHVGLFGKSGSGKSTLMLNMALSAAKRSIPVLLFDYKRSARALLSHTDTPPINVITLGRRIGADIAFNPFSPPPGVPLDAHLRQVVSEIASMFYAGDGVIAIFSRALRELTDELGTPPTLEAFAKVVREMDVKSREVQWKTSAVRIVDQLNTGQLGRVLSGTDTGVMYALRSVGITVVELDGLSAKDAALVVSLVLRWINGALLNEEGPRETTRQIVVVEEAHHLLGKRDGGDESVLEETLRQGREHGLSAWVLDQQPSEIATPVIANCSTIAVLNCQSRQDVNLAANTLLLDEQQKQLLGLLRVGEAVVRVPQHYSAIHIKVPALDLKKGSVTDAMVAQAFAESSLASYEPGMQSTEVVPSLSAVASPNRFQAQLSTEITARPVIDTTHHQATGHTAVTPTTTPKQNDLRAVDSSHSDGHGHSHSHNSDSEIVPVERQHPLDADPELRLFAEHIVAEPLLGVSARGDALRLSRRKSNAIKCTLVGLGLIREVRLNTPTGSTVLLELTDKGRAAMARRGVSCPKSTESLQHRWYKEFAKGLLEKAGWAVELEWRSHQKGINHTFDVHAERGGKILLAEVETGSSQYEVNWAMLEQAAAHQRVVLWLEASTYLMAKSKAPSGVEVIRPSELKAIGRPL